MKPNQRGQVTAEMAVLFTFVIAAFVFMGFYLQRAGQGGMKSNADSLGQQFSTTGPWNSFSESISLQKKSSTETKSNSCNKYSHGVGGSGADNEKCEAKDPGAL